MAFDPNAAAARYIDSLGPAALQKAHDYTVGREWMLLWALVVSAIVTWLVVRSGVLDRLEAKIAEPRRNLRAFVVSAVFLILSTLLSLPWSLYADYFREKGYGRTSQPLGDFLAQGAIAAVISALLGGLFLMGVYWLMRRTGRSWWLWSGGQLMSIGAFCIGTNQIDLDAAMMRGIPVFNAPFSNTRSRGGARAGGDHLPAARHPGQERAAAPRGVGQVGGRRARGAGQDPGHRGLRKHRDPALGDGGGAGNGGLLLRRRDQAAPGQRAHDADAWRSCWSARTW